MSNDRTLSFKSLMTHYENLDERSRAISLISTIVVFILTIVGLWYFKIRKPSMKKYVLIVGTSNAGKTNIFSQLAFKRVLLTQTSITPNHHQVSLDNNSKKFDVADLPGHDKIRSRFLNLYKRSARAIIFVVDSSNFTKDAKDVAQFLFEILTDDVLMSQKLKVCIACNKQDKEMVKGQKFIRVNLEKEIELLRKLSSSSLQSTDSSKSKSGKKLCKNEDVPFDFDNLKNFKVDFCEIDSQSQESIAPLSNWLLSKSF